jgi:DNA-binding LacI/PurR family transcriptional regulator
MAVTLADVALRAGVSITTASRVLARSRAVSPGVQTAVERAATELGYAGNGVARALRRSSARCRPPGASSTSATPATTSRSRHATSARWSPAVSTASS